MLHSEAIAVAYRFKSYSAFQFRRVLGQFCASVAQQKAAVHLGPNLGAIIGKRRCDLMALAAFAAAGTAPALAQSSGTWSAGISARNIRTFVHASSTNRVDRIAPGKLASGPQDLAR
jgi:hypothetical protein